MPLTAPPSAPPAAPDAPGDAPSRVNPASFRSLADAFVVWLVGLRASLAAWRTWMVGYLSWQTTNIAELAALQTDVASKQSAASTASAAAVAAADSAAHIYAGTFASDPTLRPDGTAMQNGDLYLSTAGVWKARVGGAWIPANADTVALAAAGGSALVGFQQSGVGAAARTEQAKLRETYSTQDAAVAADGVTDDGPEIGQGVSNAADVLEVLTGDHVVDTQVSVSAFKHLRGRSGWNTRLRAKAAPAVTTLFRLNFNGTTWPDAFPNVGSSKVSDLMMHAGAPGALGVQMVGFEFAGSQQFENITSIGLQNLGKQATSLYCDLVKFHRIYASAQPATGSYVIDLNGSGDGVDINQVLMFRRYTDGTENGTIDASTGQRVRGIRLKWKVGATVRNVLNGDIFMEAGNALDVASLHMEDGLVTFERATGTLRNAEFWMRGDGRGELSVTPLVVKASSASPSLATLEHLGFVYQQTFPGGYTTSKPNFAFDNATVPGAAPYMAVSVRNLYRRLSPVSGPAGSEGQRYGVTCGNADFDNYSHFASIESKFAQGAWRITAKAQALPVGDAVLDASSALGGDMVFGGAGATYFYKAQLLWDKKRRIGVTGTAEISLTPTNGGNCPVLILSSDARMNVLVRLYRGTVSGSYDFYVDVPLLAGVRLADSGSDVGGFPWVARAAGAVDTLNAAAVLSYELAPGDSAASSDAYGTARVLVASSPLPTVGAWRKGDRIERVPSPGTALPPLKYRRVTDCTEAAPAHVVGTDWVLENAIPAAHYNTDANFTLVAGTDAPVQRIIAALTATRTITISDTDVGAYFEITHGGSGAGLNVGGLITLMPGAWCKVVRVPTGWRVTQHGTLLQPALAVIQGTSKSTAVATNSRTGQITMHAASLAAGATVSFTFTSNIIGPDDLPIFVYKGGGTSGAYKVWAEMVAAGSCKVFVKNDTAGPLAEAVVLQFFIQPGAIA